MSTRRLWLGLVLLASQLPAEELAGALATYSLVDNKKEKPPWRKVRVELSSPESHNLLPLLKKSLGPSLLKSSRGKILVEISPAQTLHDSRMENFYKESTFVVDYDEPSFAALKKEFGRRKTPPSASELTSYVHEYIQNKSGTQFFDLASKVAETRKGDCTEHAVFLAAIDRLNKIPSRIVTGIVIVRNRASGVSSAIGHAWNEVFVNQKWHVADSTRPPGSPMAAAFDAFYLPFSALGDETESYTYEMAQNLNFSIQKLVLVD